MKHSSTCTHRLALLTLGVLLNLLWLGTTRSSAQNIPDANFAKAIRDQCPTCIDGDNNLLAPAKTLTFLNVSNKNISSIEGITGFSELKTLSCYGNQLTVLPALPVNLTEWGFANNRLTNLPLLPANLRALYVGSNKLTSLPTLPAGLQSLDCSYTTLSALPELPESLRNLYAGGIGLTSIPSLPAGLLNLSCENNNLTSLPTLPSTLRTLRIDAEKITCLPNAVEDLKVFDDYSNDTIALPICGVAPVEAGIHIPDANFAQAIRDFCPSCINTENNLLSPAKNLGRLEVSGKNIDSIEGVIGFIGLKSISAYNNKLTMLPALPSGLTDWGFGSNQLTSLPQIPENVKAINVGNNRLTSLPDLPAGLTGLGFDNNKISSIPALPLGLTFLNCGYTLLKSLPILPVGLQSFYCAGLGLTDLPALPVNLSFFGCENNNLTSLPALPVSLTYLGCHNNNITSLPTLPSTLRELRIDAEKITCLPNAVEGLKVYNDYSNDPIPLPLCGAAPAETGIHIPDVNFAQAIRDFCPGCINGDNNLLTPATYLNRLEVDNKNIASIEGVIGFTGLTSINAYNNQIAELPSLPSGLIFWDFGRNRITSLPQIPDNVKSLYVNGNQLTSLPTIPMGLTGLDFSDNVISNIPALPSGLTYLNCGYNPLGSLPPLPAGLQILYCGGLGLTSLPALPATLTFFGCENNNLTSLPALPSGLTYLSVPYNNITSLPTLPASLERLNLDAAKITCLPNAVGGLEVYNGYSEKVHLPVCGTTPITPANCYALGDMCSGNSAETVSPTITMSAAGSKVLTLSYRASEGGATLRLVINGTSSTVSLPQTPADRSFQSMSLGTYALNAGNNTVTLSSGSGYACFNQLCTGDSGFTPTPDPTPIPASCLALGDQCSGNANEMSTYTLVQAAAGSQMLKLTYRASEGESKLRLTINGILHSIILPQTAGGGTYQTIALGAYALNAGNNAITMATSDGYLCFRQLCAEGGNATPDPTPTPATCLALGDQCSGNASEVSTYTLVQAAAGSQALKLTYRASEGESKLRLTINGMLHSITLPRTAGGGTYQTIALGSYALNAGNNVITMATGDGYLCFRQLCTEGGNATPDPTPTPATCLALGDQCSGNASEVSNYTLVQAAAGSQVLKLTYRASEGESKLRLTINGTLHSITLPQSSTYQTIALGSYALNAGNNAITMATGNGYLCFRQLCTEGNTSNNARLSAEEVNAEAAPLAAYPNPTTGSFEACFYLAPGQRAALTVNDLLGRPIWTKALTGQGEHKEQIRLSEAASGMFILRLQRENAAPGKVTEFTKVLVVK